MLLKCKECSQEFSDMPLIDKKWRDCKGRTHCYDCSPFKLNRIKAKREELIKQNPENYVERECKVCNKTSVVVKGNNFLHICNGCRKKKNIKSHRLSAVNMFNNKCKDCQKTFHMNVYDFHHLNKDDKKYELSRLWGNSWKTIEEELEKCIMLCANCHRLRHVLEE